MRKKNALLVLSVLSLLFSNCKKDNEKPDPYSASIEDKFFTIPIDAPFTVKKVAEYPQQIYRQVSRKGRLYFMG